MLGDINSHLARELAEDRVRGRRVASLQVESHERQRARVRASLLLSLRLDRAADGRRV